MRPYRIISDSACDLSDELIKENDIAILPYYLSMDGETYLKDRVELDRDQFYGWMAQNTGKYPKTSMPTVMDLMDMFTAAGEAGEDVICLCLSKKLTSTYQTALTARSMALEQYPDMRIAVVDSMLATVMQGLLVLEACHLRDSGAEFDRAVSELERIKTTGRIFFTFKDLDYLSHGGRIGHLTGMAGTLLGIRPVVALREGELFSAGIAKGRTRSMEKALRLFIDHMAKTYPKGGYSAVVGYGLDKQEGESFRQRVCQALAKIGHKAAVPMYKIGSLIGAHIGPYPIGAAVIDRAEV